MGVRSAAVDRTRRMAISSGGDSMNAHADTCRRGGSWSHPPTCGQFSSRPSQNPPLHSTLTSRTGGTHGSASASTDSTPPFRLLVAIPLTTTTQLLDALRVRDDGGAWALLVERYDPVLRGVGRRFGLGEQDAEDAAQQTLLELVRGLRANQFDRARGGLRNWTLAILRNRIRDMQRSKAGRIARSGRVVLGAPPEAQLETIWQEEVQRQVLAIALSRLRSETRMAESTLRAFEFTAMREVPVQAAARDCGMSPEEVYVARNRVLGCLRGVSAEVEEAMEEG